MNGLDQRLLYRVLVIDDNPAIHEDLKKVLCPGPACSPQLTQLEAALFGEEAKTPDMPLFEVDSATQGKQGVDMVRRAQERRRPYALAFVDARMPPGWDGIQTIEKLWQEDPEVQVVLCTAYSDYTWQEIRARLAHPERFVVLKKPFDNIEALQLADSLTEKWRLRHKERDHLQKLERMLGERQRDQLAKEDIDAQLAAASVASNIVPLRRADGPVSPEERRSLVRRELQVAIRREQLTLHYQPVVEIATHRVVSLEALLRWTHPELGPISPGEFIPIAEESGLILPIGEFVLRSVCRQLVCWDRERVPSVPVAVNISGIQLEQLPLREFVRRILKEEGAQPQRLILELTESTIMKAPRSHAATLQQLRDDGISIEIDDFGTGYSSLSYLKYLPIDTIKIDRSFVQNLHTNSTDEAIVCAILAMTHKLGLRAVAEGVETEDQLEVLGRYACELAQGFFFCEPMSATECQKLLLDLAARTSFTDTLRLSRLDNRQPIRMLPLTQKG